jgi:hypothetical protein
MQPQMVSDLVRKRATPELEARQAFQTPVTAATPDVSDFAVTALLKAPRGKPWVPATARGPTAIIPPVRQRIASRPDGPRNPEGWAQAVTPHGTVKLAPGGANPFQARIAEVADESSTAPLGRSRKGGSRPSETSLDATTMQMRPSSSYRLRTVLIVVAAGLCLGCVIAIVYVLLGQGGAAPPSEVGASTPV